MIDKKTLIFESILIVLAISLALIVIIPEKEILGLAIKEDSIVNTGNIEVNISGGIDFVLEPEQAKEINITENKTYVGRKND